MKLHVLLIVFILGAWADCETDDSEEEALKSDHETPSNSPESSTKNEAVVDKFVNTLMTRQEYVKIVETIEKNLDAIDKKFDEKINNIVRYTNEILRTIKSKPFSSLGDTPSSLARDVDSIKHFLRSYGGRGLTKGDGAGECRLDAGLNHRLVQLETHLSSIVNSMNPATHIFPDGKDSRKMILNAGSGDAFALLSELRSAIREQKARKCDFSNIGRTMEISERYPTDCLEIQLQGFNITGIYKIKPFDAEPFYVLCDLSTAGGGWTVIQNRYDGSQDFYKNWFDYKHGFGNMAGEFWLGLEKIHYLTTQKLYELRVDIESATGQEAVASYSVFTIGPEHEGYRISTLGTYRGNAGDSLAYHAGQKFSTFDADNDEWKDGACAIEHGGAWWYKECDKSNLNGKYSTSGDDNNVQTIFWITFKGPNTPLSKTRMMIRPLPASRPLDHRRTKLGKDGVKGLDKQKYVTKEGRGSVAYRYDDPQDVYFPNYT